MDEHKVLELIEALREPLMALPTNVEIQLNDEDKTVEFFLYETPCEGIKVAELPTTAKVAW